MSVVGQGEHTARRRAGAVERHPGDLLRFTLGGVAVIVTTALVSRDRVGSLETAAFRLVNELPSGLGPSLGAVMQAGSLVAVPVTAALAAAARRRRLAGDLLVGGTATWLLAKAIKSVVRRDRPDALVGDVLVRGAEQVGLGFPSGHAAVAASLATVAGPHLPRPARRAVWGVVGAVALGRVFVGAHLPLDVVGGAAFGWMIGAGVHLVRGAPGRRPGAADVLAALTVLGLDAVDVRPVHADARGSTPFLAVTTAGRRLFVKVVGRAQRDADLLFKLYRFLALRDVRDEAPFASPKQLVEHEAYVALLAERGGARVPAVILAAQTPDRSGLLVTDEVVGTPLSDLPARDVDDDLLDRIWEQVARLRSRGIAHRDLRAANIIIDSQRRPWLVDFGFAAGAASPDQLAGDVAELLAATAARVGARRAVAAAHRNLGTDPLLRAAALLQPLALSSATRAEIRASDGLLLSEVREQIHAVTGTSVPPVTPMTRLRPRTVVGLAVLGLCVHLALPHVGALAATLEALRDIDWGPLVVAALAALAVHPASALTLMGSVSRPLAWGRTSAVVLAATVPARLGGPEAGQPTLVQRHLQRAGVPAEEAASAVDRSTATELLVHALTALLATPLALWTPPATAGLPPRWPLLVALAVPALLLALWRRPDAARWGRRLRRAARGLPALRTRPRRGLLVFGGAAAATAAHVAAFAATLHALAVVLPASQTIAVAALGAALRTLGRSVGGLGIVEAALVAGLLLAGVPAGRAVVAVLSYRLLTFWLPLAAAVPVRRIIRRRQLA